MIQCSHSKTSHIKQLETWENVHISLYYAKYKFTVSIKTSLYSIIRGDVTFHYYQEVKKQKKKIKTNDLICDKQKQVLYIHKQYGFPGTHI